MTTTIIIIGILIILIVGIICFTWYKVSEDKHFVENYSGWDLYSVVKRTIPNGDETLIEYNFIFYSGDTGEVKIEETSFIYDKDNIIEEK